MRGKGGIATREKGETGTRGKGEIAMIGKRGSVKTEKGGMSGTGEKTGIGGLRGKGERTEMTEKEKTGRGKTLERREMTEIEETSETGEKTERGERTGTNGMTGPRGTKEHDETTGRRKGEKSQSLCAPWTSLDLQSGPSLRWTHGLLYRRAPQRTTRSLGPPRRLTAGPPCPDTTHL